MCSPPSPSSIRTKPFITTLWWWSPATGTASHDDIYITDADLYSYSYTTSFDGEGELPATFSEQVEKENIELNPFSLLNVDEIPEDADAVLIYAPSSDISEEEANMLTIHLDNENFQCVQIDLYRYDGESCLAVVDGESVSLVPRSSVVDLMEAVNAIVL